MVSASSFLSKSSGKYSVDQYAAEAGDKGIKSKFDSSSSSSSGESDSGSGSDGAAPARGRRGTAGGSELGKARGPLAFLRRQTLTHAKAGVNEALPRRNTERHRSSKKEDPANFEEAKRQRSRAGTVATWDIPNKPKRNTEGYYDKKGWVLKKASTTYLGMTNWQRRFIHLKNEKLFFFDGDTPADMVRPKKTIDMRHTKCVCYHYDQFAPIKSNKLAKRA